MKSNEDNKIEPLEEMDLTFGILSPGNYLPIIVSKINEIIEYINGKEENNSEVWIDWRGRTPHWGCG